MVGMQNNILWLLMPQSVQDTCRNPPREPPPREPPSRKSPRRKPLRRKPLRRNPPGRYSPLPFPSLRNPPLWISPIPRWEDQMVVIQNQMILFHDQTGLLKDNHGLRMDRMVQTHNLMRGIGIIPNHTVCLLEFNYWVGLRFGYYMCYISFLINSLDDPRANAYPMRAMQMSSSGVPGELLIYLNDKLD